MLTLMVNNMLPIVELDKMLLSWYRAQLILDLKWLSYQIDLLSYYYFRFLAAILIFDRRRYRPLLLDVIRGLIGTSSRLWHDVSICN